MPDGMTDRPPATVAARIARAVNRVEEGLIAGILAAMTLITFANVVARYVFNDNLLWALEATVFLFAWLVLLGASVCVKHNLHLGVDALVKLLPPGGRRALTLVAAAACVLFALLLLKGSWDYWHPFVGQRAFLETDDVPMPGVLQFLAVLLNEGEAYEKLPRFIPYFALPLGSLLLCLRFGEAAWQIARGDGSRLLVAAHEVPEHEDGHEDGQGQATPAPIPAPAPAPDRAD